MSLLESIASKVKELKPFAGMGEGQHPGLMDAIESLVTSPETGGIQGLMSAFEQKGLGNIIASWVGTGENLPISAAQLQSVLGNERIQAIAQKLGFTPEEAASHLTELLPQVIDKLTPEGKIPESSIVTRLFGLFRGEST